MSTDCWFTVQNKNGVTIEDFRRLVAENNYPAGEGEFEPDEDFPNKDTPAFNLSKPVKAYHRIVFGIFLYDTELWPGCITIFDGCRYSGGETDPTYVANLSIALKEIAGGNVEVFPEH